MPYYHRVGDVPRKRHTVFRAADGSRHHEELMGQEGFSSRSSLLYHRHSPSALSAIEAIDDVPDASALPDHPLVPRHLRTDALSAGADAYRTLAKEVLARCLPTDASPADA